MDVTITEKYRIKRATAAIRNNTIRINLPRHWSKKDKDEAIRILTRRVREQQYKEEAILQQFDESALISINSPEELNHYVTRINHTTLNAPLKKVRIGSARYSRLAQVNLKTGIITVSRFCLNSVPESALRYLIVHELAHFYERSHNRRFWELVATHVPDYKHQIKIMNAFHGRAVQKEVAPKTEPIPLFTLDNDTPEPIDNHNPEGFSRFSFRQLSFLSRLFPGR